MKVWQWYFLVFVSTCLLITTFFTKNIVVTIGTFILVMHLNRHTEKIPLPKQFRKYNILSQKTKKIFKADIKE
ncbi:hypothetical protein [Thermohalobacter berrensis]|uniref:Uncharacterized protein n=1 Tax=Thermohalobacter berrensis TaxID=99594 RepID=A0A419SZ94_9FIRM|nr:hypothetical protein [Thermohalobacter berrensis]RKD30525.1 hypothetical protein BET03_04085 [Thermohalobacter berrensis]